MAKFKNSNATFKVIFKQCANVSIGKTDLEAMLDDQFMSSH